jgi:DNA adenine methylase
MAKPFIKWVGGKKKLIDTFEMLLPKDLVNMENMTYIEPFVGGGAMLFFMLQKFHNITKAIINDVNPDLIKAYKVIKTKPEKIIISLEQIQREYLKLLTEEKRKAFYLESRDIYNNNALSDIENTMYLIFLNRTCFNGLYRVNSKGKFNVPFGRYSNPKICDADTIYSDSELLQKVQMINGDFEQTEDYITENTFMYFDPPYRPLDATSSFNSYAKEAFNDEEQIRLKEYYDRLSERGCLLMLSNSDCRGRNPDDTFFDDLYSKYDIQRVFTNRSVSANPSKRGKLSELLIRNYDNIATRESETNININTIYEQRTYKRTV